MQSAFIATCPNSNEAVIVVLGVTTVSEFRAAAAAQGLIRTCDDEEGYEFYKPLQAWVVLTPEGTWDLGASSDTPDALPAMVATARWVSITSCQCEACPVNEGTHKPAGALLQIDEPKSSVNQVDEAINSLLRAALIEGGCSAERVIEAREETNLRRAELRTLLSTPQPCSRSHPHEEMTPMCELRTEIARLTNALARTEAAALPWPRAEVDDLLERLVSSHISSFIAGERGSNKPEAREFVKSALVEAAGFIRAVLYPLPPAEGVPAQAPQNLLAELERIAEKYAWAFQDAGTETYAEQVQAKTRKAKQALTAELKSALATHPTQQGLDAIAALQKVRDIAVSALLTGSLDRQDWIDDMDRIAAQAKQGEQA